MPFFRNVGRLWIPCGLFLLIFFQNCQRFAGNQDSAVTGSSGSALTDAPADHAMTINGRIQPQAASLSDLALWRERIWAARCEDNSDWEVCFDGGLIPGFDQPAHLDWDNPRDDDWNRSDSRRLSWRTGLSDSEAATFMRVDRTVEGFRNFTGHFWRRDEFLSAVSGVEAAIRTRILPQSQRFGVMFHYRDDVHQFKFHFAPDQISFHPLVGMGSASTAIQVRRNTSMTAFVVRKEPGSGEVKLWADGVRMFVGQSLVSGSVGELWQPVSGQLGMIAPQIGFGDNNNDFDDERAGAYDMDYFYYRRTAQPGGRAGLRSPPPLPNPDSCADWRTLRTENSGQPVTAVNSSLGTLIADVLPSRFTRVFEIETRLLRNGSESRGFSFDYFDKLGGVHLTVYPDRLALKAGGKPGLPTVARVTGFDGTSFNRLRLARGSDGLYWHLFLNDKPVPVLVDVRASGFSTRGPEFLFGPFLTLAINDLAESQSVLSREPTGAAAEVRSIRWCH